jgi:hypothetical protein
MLERLQSDFNVARQISAPAAHRADLVATPAPNAAELRDKAVAPTGHSHRSTTEADSVSASLRAIQQAREGFREVHRSEADQEELDRILERILPGYKALREKSDAPGLVHDAMLAVDQLDAFERKMMKASAGRPAADPAPVVHMSMEREKTLARIEAAILKVGALRDKLAVTRFSAHERLLNINASVSGLNMARMQVSDDKIMMSLASSACESIMMNVRSVVVAHGNVSPDLVRLILS